MSHLIDSLTNFSNCMQRLETGGEESSVGALSATDAVRSVSANALSNETAQPASYISERRNKKRKELA